MRTRYLCRMAIAAALMTTVSTSMVLAADSSSSANHALRTPSATAAKSLRVSTASVAAAAPRRCVTIACPGYLIVGIAF